MTILVGNIVRTYATFKDIDDELQDPTTVQVQIKDPSANIATYIYGTDAELVRASIGKYYIETDTSGNAGGTYQIIWNSTGTYKAAGQTYFTVADTLF